MWAEIWHVLSDRLGRLITRAFSAGLVAFTYQGASSLTRKVKLTHYLKCG
jgi:hypothetical protein